MDTFYVKSFEDDYSTKTLVGDQKEVIQTAADIVQGRVILPNTISFGKERRLCTTILCPNYTITYRPQGIIFQTDEQPDYILPFDMSLVSQAQEMVVEYYKIKDNIHLYYNHPLIPDCERFFFQNLEDMIAAIPSPQDAWRLVNEFRVSHCFQPLRPEEFRLVQYNEAVFSNPVTIQPSALFGEDNLGRQLSSELGLPLYASAADFYHENQLIERDTPSVSRQF